MNLKPLGDNVILKQAEEEANKFGLILSTSTHLVPEEGEVIAVGEGRLADDGSLLTMQVKVGDRVYFKKYSPDEIKIGEDKYLILSERDVLCIADKQ